MTESDLDDLDNLRASAEPEKSPADETEEEKQNREQQERKRAEKQREMMEKMYFRMTNEQLLRPENSGTFLRNMFGKWDGLRSDIRDNLAHIVCQALAKTPRPPIELAEKLVADIGELVARENIPEHPLRQYNDLLVRNNRDSIPPHVGSEIHNERAKLYSDKIAELQGKVRIVCDQHQAAYEIWLINNKRNEQIQAAATIRISEQPQTSFVPLESGIRAKKSPDNAEENDDNDMYDRVRRSSGTMRRILQGTPLPSDILKQGTTDEEQKK